MPMDCMDCPLGSSTVNGVTAGIMWGASEARSSVWVEPVSAQKEDGTDSETVCIKLQKAGTTQVIGISVQSCQSRLVEPPVTSRCVCAAFLSAENDCAIMCLQSMLLCISYP